jgi:hypothetical protein
MSISVDDCKNAIADWCIRNGSFIQAEFDNMLSSLKYEAICDAKAWVAVGTVKRGYMTEHTFDCVVLRGLVAYTTDDRWTIFDIEIHRE